MNEQKLFIFVYSLPKNAEFDAFLTNFPQTGLFFADSESSNQVFWKTQAHIEKKLKLFGLKTLQLGRNQLQLRLLPLMIKRVQKAYVR